jgi:pimeloyl-ACP methyl ester carboxylesterase
MLGYRDRFAQVGDLNLRYLDWDNVPGAPVALLLHGGAQNCHDWDDVAEFLAPTHRVIVPDCRNHGMSDRSSGDYSYAEMVADVMGIIDQLGIGEFGLMGHSMGGRQALALVALHPDRVRWLVLEDTPPVTDPAVMARMRASAPRARVEFASLDEMKVMQKAMAPFASPEVLERKALFARVPLPGGEVRPFHSPGSIPADLQGVDGWEAIRDIRCPVLLVRGTESPMFSEADATRMESEIPDARLVRIGPAGHLVHEDQPAAFNQALAEFLDLPAGT